MNKYFFVSTLLTLTFNFAIAAPKPPKEVQEKIERIKQRSLEERGTPETAKTYLQTLIDKYKLSVADAKNAAKWCLHTFDGNKVTITLHEAADYLNIYRDAVEGVRKDSPELADAYQALATHGSELVGLVGPRFRGAKEPSPEQQSFFSMLTSLPDMATWTPEQISSYTKIFEKFNSILKSDENITPESAWTEAVRELHPENAEKMLENARNCQR